MMAARHCQEEHLRELFSLATDTAAHLEKETLTAQGGSQVVRKARASSNDWLCYPTNQALSDEALDQLISENSLFPTKETADFLKIRCLRELERKDENSAAFTLLHCQSHAFRHQALSQYHRRIRRREERMAKNLKEKAAGGTVRDLDESDFEAAADTLMKKALQFESAAKGSNERVEALLKKLPADWRIVHIAVEPNLDVRFKKAASNEAVKENNLPLVIAAFSCGSELQCSVQRVPRMERQGCPTIMDELGDILRGHGHLYKKTENFKYTKYNNVRDELDSRLKTLLTTVEKKWLGAARLLLLGKPKGSDRTAKIEATIASINEKLTKKIPERLLFYLLDGAALLKSGEIREECSKLVQNENQSQWLAKKIVSFSMMSYSVSKDRSPVVFVLDKEIQSFPWESLDLLRNQPCSRVPSIFFLSALYEVHEMSKNSVTKFGVKSERIFYILNPDKDLEKTQKRLETPLRELSIDRGVIGEWPTSTQLQKALTDMDAFMYCGHGARMKTLTSQEIEKLRIRAVPLLFGCNSGRLEQIGRSFDPIGVSNSYLIATAPCMLGFLWTVTDKDVDEFTISFLRYWLRRRSENYVPEGIGAEPTPSDGERDFVRAVAKTRFRFSRLLNSAALVVYGLPAFLGQDDRTH